MLRTRTGTLRRNHVAAPGWLLLPAAIGVIVIGLPIVGLAATVPWGRFLGLISSPSSLTALRLSLQTAAAATVIVVILGVPIAILLARSEGRWARPVRAVVLVPLVLPPVVGGLALLYTFGRGGIAGARLQALGIDIAFSTTAVVLAQVFVSLPFLVLSLEGALRGMDTRYEAVASTLGARPVRVLRKVTLPMVMPGLVSGVVLAFARSLGEFGATITFAGSLQGRTRTLPLEIYLQRVDDPDAAVALSMVLIVVAVVVVVAIHGRGARSRGPRGRKGPEWNGPGRGGPVRGGAREELVV
ncbi:ABC transporter permease [Tomitella fengzijianii]|uniref:Molybdenum transport system permease n=1 Tax=Tomitella fengzijianii TaxID=2597660 RepID=A0A516X1L1_9ACTN|nr:ABC transporter permease [Tomitella fengzijianii]QDQ96972.1 molybdate ABC transporter permease subunit [Tomitella fengzijianii]